MNAGPHSSPVVWLPAAALAVAVAAAVGLVAVGGLADVVGQAVAPAGVGLNVDALPAQARGWAIWVIRAGTICPQVTAPLIAAQIEQESDWRAGAVAHNPAERGGDAMGLVQFQASTWGSWGSDADADGTSSPFDPEDAIWAQGRLMCDLVAWADRNLTAGNLHGDPVDLALAAYFCGRGCIVEHGGVPAGGLAHDYPAGVRARIATYRLAATAPGGAWALPLPPGSYTMGSGFGMRWGRLHAGVDLIAAPGTPILAVAAGVVLDAGCTSPRCDIPGSLTMPGCGLRVNVNHGAGLVSRSCHAVALTVAAGQRVAAGQLLGWVGSTGHSSGPHLHIETHLGAPPATSGTAVDPVPLLRAAGVQL